MLSSLICSNDPKKCVRSLTMGPPMAKPELLAAVVVLSSPRTRSWPAGRRSRKNAKARATELIGARLGDDRQAPPAEPPISESKPVADDAETR